MSDNVENQNLSPAEIAAIRAQRIENLQDPKAKQAIADIQKERTEASVKSREEQRKHFDENVEKELRAKIRSRNSPSPAPAGLKPSPIIGKAAEDYHRGLLQNNRRVADDMYIAQQEKQYDQKIDQILDKAEGKSPPFKSLSAAVPSDPALASRTSPSGGKPPPSLSPSRPSGHVRDYSALREASGAPKTEPTQQRKLVKFEDLHPASGQAKTTERGQDTKAASPSKQEGQEKPQERKLVRFEDLHPLTKGRDIDR